LAPAERRQLVAQAVLVAVNRFCGLQQSSSPTSIPRGN
jgi:hypothetical protein